MTPGAFIALTAVVGVAAITPGPAVTAIAARAISDGLRPAMAINAGVVTGDLVFLTLAAAGMSALARSAGELFLVLKFAGAAYLAWQAWQFWRAVPRPLEAGPATGHEAHFWRNYGAGLLLMAGHAQAMIFYAALLPGFVDFRTLTLADFSLLALVIVIVIGGCNMLYGIAATRARRFVATPAAQRTMNRIAGALMLFGAALVLTR